jgi:hypothetical protein
LQFSDALDVNIDCETYVAVHENRLNIFNVDTWRVKVGSEAATQRPKRRFEQLALMEQSVFHNHAAPQNEAKPRNCCLSEDPPVIFDSFACRVSDVISARESGNAFRTTANDSQCNAR